MRSITPVIDDGVDNEKSSLSPNSSFARSSRELYSAHAPQKPSGSALHHNTPVSLYGTQSFTINPPPMSNSGKHRLPSWVHFVVVAASATAANPANATRRQILRIRALLAPHRRQSLTRISSFVSRVDARASTTLRSTCLAFTWYHVNARHVKRSVVDNQTVGVRTTTKTNERTNTPIFSGAMHRRRTLLSSKSRFNKNAKNQKSKKTLKRDALDDG